MSSLVVKLTITHKDLVEEVKEQATGKEGKVVDSTQEEPIEAEAAEEPIEGVVAEAAQGDEATEAAQEEEQPKENSQDKEASEENDSGASLEGEGGSEKESTDPDAEDPTNFFQHEFQMVVETQGKFSRKATWQDLAALANVDVVDSDVLKAWIYSYQKQNFPEQLEIPNVTPRWCWIKDIKNTCDCYKTYGWKPVKFHVQPGLIDVKERWTKQVTLTTFQLNYATDVTKVVAEQEFRVVNSLRKSALKGHNLAAAVVEDHSESNITVDFKGIDATTIFTLGLDPSAAVVDEETGDKVWKDSKSLQALLQDKDMPEKRGKGVNRTIEVLGLKSYLKARIYYKGYFTGTVSTDHGLKHFNGRRYWNWDMKYLLRYNDVPNAALVYEDVELEFYSNVHVRMENEDFEWIRSPGGQWAKKFFDPSKQKKYENAAKSRLD